MKLTVYSDFDSVQAFQDEWVELLGNSVVSTVFQSPAFIQTWWEIFGKGSLHLILFRENDVLVGIAPLHIIEKDTQNILTFIGDRDITDIQDFIVHQSYLVQVYEALETYLGQHSELWNIIDLFSIPDHSPTLTLLHLDPSKKSVIQQSGFDDKNQQAYEEVIPVIHLPESWDAYLNSLERKQRHEVRRKFKKLTESLPHRFVLVEDTRTNPDAVEIFINLHKASASYKEAFWTEQRETFFTVLLERLSTAGWLKLFFLYVDDIPVASMLIFDYNEEYQLYNSGYDASVYREYSTGQVLTSYTIKHAIEQGKKQYNFLRGNQEYKFRLGGKPKMVWDLRFD